MPDQETVQQFATPRRTDRQVTDTDTLKAWLATADIGYLATTAGDQPFLTPLQFWFDGERIFFHTAKKGRALDNIKANPNICFSVAERGRYLPAETALNFGVEYKSVVVFGRAGLVEDGAAKTYALQGLLNKYFPHLKPGSDYRPITPGELAITAVFEIEITAMSGKQKKAGSTFPTEGSFRAFNSLDEVSD